MRRAHACVLVATMLASPAALAGELMNVVLPMGTAENRDFEKRQIVVQNTPTAAKELTDVFRHLCGDSLLDQEKDQTRLPVQIVLLLDDQRTAIENAILCNSKPLAPGTQLAVPATEALAAACNSGNNCPSKQDSGTFCNPAPGVCESPRS